MEEDLFGGSRVGRRFWLLGLAQAAHSMEEMRTRLYDFMWIATERLGLPRMGMSATTFALVNMGILLFLLGAAPFVAARRDWAIVVAWVVAIIEIANGIGHLTALLLFRGYAPGAITAPLLIAAGLALIRALARERARG
ncbi:MAG TPA: HXXEE domain-containing protein [Thermoanaerobaculia bacterium]|jgi:hypothetical protein|nr:HXXEE domain-containing protein [Thermoanaerobaculia bacterium]